MGSSNKQGAIDETFRLNREMENSLYSLSKPALQAGTSYLTGAYNQGGFDQSAKYGAMQTQALDTPLGGNILQGKLGQAAGNRASALAGIGGQRIAAGVDEMNKLRSMLAQKGLRTTNLAQEAGAQSIQAINQMAPGNQTLSTILGVGAAGASVYGGIQGANAQSDVAKQLRQQQTSGNPFLGSDLQTLQQGGGYGPRSNTSWGGGGWSGGKGW